VEDSRDTVEESMVKIVAAGGGYTPQEGDSVIHKNHATYGVGKVTSLTKNTGSASVYWPRNDHTTVQGIHNLREKKPEWTAVDSQARLNELKNDAITAVKKQKAKKPDGEWVDLPPEQKEGLWVKHLWHPEFGTGVIMFQHQNAGGYIDSYRVKWKHNTERDHKAAILKPYDAERDKEEPDSFSAEKMRMKGDPIKTEKDPNPNRGFKFHKRGKNAVYVPFHERDDPTKAFTHSEEKARCRACHTVVKSGDAKWVKIRGGHRLYCTNCYNRKINTTPHGVKKRLSSTLQRIRIRDLSRRKGVKTTADLDNVSYTAARMIIEQWEQLPDVHIDPSVQMGECSVGREPCSPHSVVRVESTEYLACTDDCRAEVLRGNF